MQNRDLSSIARRRASAKFGFLIHLGVFIAVNLGLAALNYGLNPGSAWHRFPLAGWALGLAIHGLAVFFSGSGLRERMVDAEMKRLEARRTPGAR
jgi:hypothetical protein